MAVSASWYRNPLMWSASGKYSWIADTIKVALGASTYTPNTASHQNWIDVSANEVSGTGYTASGVTASGKTLTLSGSLVSLDADDVSWANSTVQARYAWIVDVTPGTAACNILLGLVDFGSTMSTNAGTFLIQWSTSGVLNLIAQ